MRAHSEVGWWGEIDDGLLRIFLHLPRCKKRKMKRRQLSERKKNFVYSKSEEESREEGGALKEKAKKSIHTGPLSAAAAAFSCVE